VASSDDLRAAAWSLRHEAAAMAAALTPVAMVLRADVWRGDAAVRLDDELAVALRALSSLTAALQATAIDLERRAVLLDAVPG
jgi:hypothetical protein